MKRRILAILLACMMVLSAVPFTAFAEGAEPKCPGGDKLVHTKDNCEYTKFATVEAVCGNIGYTAYTCNGCGAEFIADIVPANTDETHDFSIEIPAKAATCTEPGYEAGKECSKCHQVEGKTPVPAIGHDYKTTSTSATCTEGGIVTKVCNNCGDTITSEIPANGHALPEHPTFIAKPDCDGEGVARYQCANCEYHEDVPVRVVPHVLEKTDAKAPTCTEAGNIEYWYCADCDSYFADAAATNEIDEEDTVLSALGHDFSVEVEKVASSCEAVVDPVTGVISSKVNVGYTVYKCSRCEETKTVNDSADYQHNWSDYETLEPTCVDYGFQKRICKTCGIEEKVKIKDPLGHTTYEEAIAVTDATLAAKLNLVVIYAGCETDGLASWKCLRCDTACKKVLTANGHSMTEVTVDPTCMTVGYTFQYCTNACEVYSKVGTHTVDGKTYDVTVEGNTVALDPTSFVVIPVNPENHNLKTEILNESTCTKKGDAVTYCQNDGCKEYNYYELPLAEHDYDATIAANVTVVAPADCINPEKISVKCSMCDSTEEQTRGSANGHSTTTTVYPASCLTNGQGYSVEKCANCDYENTVYDQNVLVDKGEWPTVDEANVYHKGLDLFSKAVFKEGNCEKLGLYSYECDDCGRKVFVAIPETGNGHKDDGVYDKTGEIAPVAPDCLNGGNTATYICTVCGALVEGNDLPALGHDIVSVGAKAPTCTETGYDAYEYCARNCGYTTRGADIAANGHKIVPHAANPSTCTEDGWYAYDTCENCDYSTYVVDPADGHADNVLKTRVGSCELEGYVLHGCPKCSMKVYIDNFVDKTNHKWDAGQVLAGDEATCLNPGTLTYTCGNAWHDAGVTKTDVIPQLPHQNAAQKAAGEGKLVNSCLDTTEDRYCVNGCNATIGQDHAATDVTTVAPTCTEIGYTVTVCHDCQWIDPSSLVIVPATDHDWTGAWVEIEGTGTEVLACLNNCGETQTRDIERVELDLEVSNSNPKNVQGGYADSSLVAVKVKLAGFNANVASVAFDLVYSSDVVYIESVEITDSRFAIQEYNKKGDRVSFAFMNIAPTTIDEDADFATVYFRIDNKDATSANFSFENVTAFEKVGEDVRAEAVGKSIAIVKFMDVYADGKYDMQDALAIYDVISNDNYNVAADLNKDGVVDVLDLDAFCKFVVENLGYTDVTALRPAK